MRTYQEETEAAKAAEFDWIKTEYDQMLSDEVDRLCNLHPVADEWRDMLAEYGRAATCIELMHRRSNIEVYWLRRKGEIAAEEAGRPLADFNFDNDMYFRDRPWCINTPGQLEAVKKMDADFVAQQKTTGFCTKEIERKISERQQSESERIAWEAEKQRRDAAAKAEKRMLKDEADQRQADKFEKAVAAAVDKVLKNMLMDVVASGVLRGK
jgi:hypothetical protein